MANRSEPSFESLRSHAVPEWFEDAKFEIFVQWTKFSIPAIAPQAGSLSEIMRDHPNDPLKYNPYAEWYQNTAKFSDRGFALDGLEDRTASGLRVVATGETVAAAVASGWLSAGPAAHRGLRCARL